MAQRISPHSPPPFSQERGSLLRAIDWSKFSHPCMHRGAEAAMDILTPSIRLMPCIRNSLSISVLLALHPCPCLAMWLVTHSWTLTHHYKPQTKWPGFGENTILTFLPFFFHSTIAVEYWRFLGMPEVLQFPRGKLIIPLRHQFIAVVSSNETR